MRPRLGIFLLALLMVACQSTGSSSPAASTAPESAGASASAPAELEHIKMGVGINRSIMHAAVWIAREVGYFADEGLDVEVVFVDGTGQALQQLIAGNIDIALGSGTAALSVFAQGHDIAETYTYFYQSVLILTAPEGSGITEIEDLQGKVIGISEPSGGEVPFVRGMLAGVGLEEGTDYEFLPVGDGGALTHQAITNGDVDAYSSSVFDVASLGRFGLDLVSIMPDEFTFIPQAGFEVTRATLDERSDMLVRFQRAIAKASLFMRLNHEAAEAITEKWGADLYEDPEVAESIWAATNVILTPPDHVDPDCFGCHDREAWLRYIEAVAEGSSEDAELVGQVNLDDILDSSTLDASNDFDRAEVEQDAAEWTIDMLEP